VNAFPHKTKWFAAICLSGIAGVLTYRAAAPADPQTPSTTPAAPATSPSGGSIIGARQTSPFAPPVADALRLLDGGVSEDVVKSYIQSSPAGFALTADQVVALKERGVPSDVVVAMFRRNKELRSQAAQARLAANRLTALTQLGYMPEVAPGYRAIQPAVYAPHGSDYVAPLSYNYSYPAYSYSCWTYPLSSIGWWTPAWGCYPYGRYYPQYQHHRRPGYYGAPYWPHGWADAYPNRLIAGPTWSADDGFAAHPAGSQRRWADAYPNRLVAGPTWSADHGFAARPAASQKRWAAAYPNRLIAGPTWSANRGVAARPANSLVRGTAGGFAPRGGVSNSAGRGRSGRG